MGGVVAELIGVKHSPLKLPARIFTGLKYISACILCFYIRCLMEFDSLGNRKA